MAKLIRRRGVGEQYPNISRHVPAMTKIYLVSRAAGQCEFPGCRKYLFEHHLTLKEGNFAEFAHIIAFNPNGPRGGDISGYEGVHDVNNLMLLCHEDHKLVDDHPMMYPPATLRKQKAEHEARICHLISLSPSMRTVLLQLKCRVAGQPVDIPADDIMRAVTPRYPITKPGTVIDLNELNSESRLFYRVASEQVRRRIREFYEGDEVQQVRHISLFALGPIPLLVFLGNALSSTISVDLYQRQRHPETWEWKNGGDPVQFELRKVRAGSDQGAVALLLSLSGQLYLNQLPSQIDSRYTVYEIRPIGTEPRATLVQRREVLENFKDIYHEFLGRVTALHSEARSIQLFPAVPAPIAVMCGREILRKKHPRLEVWDLNKKTNKYKLTIKVN